MTQVFGLPSDDSWLTPGKTCKDISSNNVRSQPCKLYVIECGQFFKMGCTTNVEARIQSHLYHDVNGWTPFGRNTPLRSVGIPIHIWGYYPAKKGTEYQIHKEHREFQLGIDDGRKGKLSEWYPVLCPLYHILKTVPWIPVGNIRPSMGWLLEHGQEPEILAAWGLQ